MSQFEGIQPKKRRARPQAIPKKESIDLGRREALRKITEALGAGAFGAAAAASGLTGIAIRNFLESPSEKKSAKSKQKPSYSKQPSLNESQHIESKDRLAAYTFLNTEEHPKAIKTGDLSGQRFSTLYAEYLGMPEGSTVPEVLHTDFKANLAELWREKFGFNVRGRTPEQELEHREKFLSEHRDLMDLAERLYRSYEPAQAEQMSLDKYTVEIKDVIKNAHTKFMDAMYALRDNTDFTKPRRALIEKMANRIGADTLLACSLTELMPSAQGKINTAVLDFLLQQAGADFLYRIPSVHDLLPSFGPYQITPALFGRDGAGTLSEKMEKHFPKGFMPESVYEVSGRDHHRVAYIAAVEHIVQFVGRLNEQETAQVQSLLDHTPLELLHREVAVFTATAHHAPSAAYEVFSNFVEHASHQTIHKDSMGHLLERIHNKSLQRYAHKALINYDFLSTSGSFTNIADTVS